jgi:hypothetical protein
MPCIYGRAAARALPLSASVSQSNRTLQCSNRIRCGQAIVALVYLARMRAENGTPTAHSSTTMHFSLCTLFTLVATAHALQIRDKSCCGCQPPVCSIPGKREDLPTPVPLLELFVSASATQTLAST